jgi:hypothetical protein
MTRAKFLRTSAASLIGAPLLVGSSSGGRLRMATFRSEVTPSAGAPLIWTSPVVKVEDPLWAKGVVIEDDTARYVLCAMDWCGLANSTYLLFRNTIAAAAGTVSSRVALHSVHQHTAPYVDGAAYELLGKLPNPPLRMSDRQLRVMTDLLTDAVKRSTDDLQPFDRVGIGRARVERVASARRIHTADGKLLTRFSTGGSEPAMAAAPEGPIDPEIRTVTLARGTRPLVRIHFYATHPQTFCCNGRVSADFVGDAREKVEQKTGIPQIYFTGCAGDVTVGKYNDRSAEARAGLAARLAAAMEASASATELQHVGPIRWKTVPLKLPLRADPAFLQSRLAKLEARPQQDSEDELYRSAIAVAFARRDVPLEGKSLRLGRVRILCLPGEPMLIFQRFAQELKPAAFIAVAGYGDISPGYLCTDGAFQDGGYEPGASNAGPGTEAAVKDCITSLLED